MLETVEVGQQFTWQSVDGGLKGRAVVNATRTDTQEGLAPESEDYAALWYEAEGLSGALAGQQFTLVLAIDGKSYLGGREITVQAIAEKS